MEFIKSALAKILYGVVAILDKDGKLPEAAWFKWVLSYINL